jgi:hypothetical protein
MNSVITVTLIPIVSFIIGNILIFKLANLEYVNNLVRSSGLIFWDKIPLNLRFYGYNQSSLLQYWGVFDQRAFDSEIMSLRLDLLFPVLYGATIIYSTLYLWNNLDKPFPILWVLLPIVTTMITDWGENIILLTQIQRYTAISINEVQSKWISIASIATQLKLFSGIFAFLLLFWLTIRSLNKVN